MTEAAEHPTTPTLTVDPPPPAPVDRGGRRGEYVRARSNRLYQALALVGIVVGVMFIVGMVFFSGFFMGKHTSGGFNHRTHPGIHVFHRGGPPRVVAPGQLPPPGVMPPWQGAPGSTPPPGVSSIPVPPTAGR
jgi:hypothetical protein